MEKQIHLVAFNVPFPPDYGGVIDIFYKIKALHNAGVSVILHCFEYGRVPSPELEKFCEKVYYYPRKSGFGNLFSMKPYIVATRDHQSLLKNLTKTVAPIIFEGLHTTYFLKHPGLKNHKKIVRTHNVEHDYYQYLSRTTTNLREQLYFTQEAYKLKKYEQILHQADHLLCISQADTNYFNSKFGKSIYLPAFHPFSKIESECGQGEYIVYHGNLEVAENINAVNFLIDKVFAEITYLFIIVGKNPPRSLVDKVQNIPHVSLLSDVSPDLMDKLIRESHICLIPTFQPTGLKLKLLGSLFAGRHCVTNSSMVQFTGLESLCHIADTSEDMISIISALMEKKFKNTDIENRAILLEELYSNEKNVQKILDIL